MVEPDPRWGHFSTHVGGQCSFIYGGHSREEHSFWKKEVVKWDPFNESWTDLVTSGAFPNGVFNGACTSSATALYTYGGEDKASCKSGCLHKLDIGTLEWMQLASFSPGPDSPMAKIGCQMVIHQDNLVLFGGYGVPSGPMQPGAEHFKNTQYSDGRGWTNELHYFNLKEGKWHSPKVTGTRPPPCSKFSLTKVDDHTAVLFGGFDGPKYGINESTYLLDLNKMHWSVMSQNGKHCPERRTRHAATCLDFGGEHPQLLIIGGADESSQALKDAWLLDAQTGIWKEVKNLKIGGRYLHSASAFTLVPGIVEVMIFGGCSEWQPNQTRSDVRDIARTTILRFVLSELNDGLTRTEWTLSNTMHVLGKRANFFRNRRSPLQEKLMLLNQSSSFLEGKVRLMMETFGLKEESYKEVLTEVQLDEIVEVFRRDDDFHRGFDNAYTPNILSRSFLSEWKMIKGPYATYSRLICDFVAIDDTAGARLICRLLQNYTPALTSSPSTSAVLLTIGDLVLFEENIGNGAFASVYQACYKNEICAAKMLLHHAKDMLLGASRVPVQESARESILKECSFLEELRHKNVIRHITTTFEPKSGLPILVMELMDCSLKKFIPDQRPLSFEKQLIIIQGVACGLHYLHSKNIIHRDLCDDNILLKQSPKLSVKIADFGMSKLLDYTSMSATMTAVGHRRGYLPPEGEGFNSDDDEEDDVKVRYSHRLDIYSFGAVATQVVQSADQFKTRKQLQRTFKQIPKEHQLKEIIAKCIDKDSKVRPVAEYVHKELSFLLMFLEHRSPV